MVYDVEMPSCGITYIPNFMMIGTSIQAILRFCLSKLRSCNIGITDGRGL
jgi:hypothetical protein